MNSLDRDAHVVGRELVLARRLHGDAEFRLSEEDEEQAGQCDRDRDHREFINPQDHPAELPVRAGDGAFQRQRIMTPDEARDEAQ